MAITKLLHLKEAGKHTPGKHLRQAMQYICNLEKTQNGKLIGALNCQMDSAYEQMIKTKQYFNKLNQRQGYHFIISFEEGEVTSGKAFEIVGAFARKFLERDYETVYAVHDDTEHIHGHIIFNSVSYRNGIKYRYELGDWKKKIQPIVNRLCEENALSTIVLEEEKQQTGSQNWKEYKEESKVWNKMIRRDLDACVLNATDYDAFINMLRAKGYEVKQGKQLAVRPPSMKRFRRCKSLGEDYTEENLRTRIENELQKDKKRHAENPRIVRTYVKRYRRKPLTKMQKRYFLKLYRTGQLRKRPYSQAWKYKEEIQQFQRLKQQYLFLCRSEIQDGVELQGKIQILEAKKKEIEKQKKTCYSKRAKFKELFQLEKQAEYLNEAVSCYNKGDIFFQKEYEEFEMIKSGLSKQGYTLMEIQNLRNYFENELSNLKEQEVLVKCDLESAKTIQIEMKKRKSSLEERKENQKKHEKSSMRR